MIEEAPETVDSFKYVTAGIDDFVKPILEGRYGTSDDPIIKRYLDDPAIRRYVDLKLSGHLEQMTIEDMRRLAIKLLELTARKTPCVGGPTQVVASERDEDAALEVVLPPDGSPLARDYAKLPSSYYTIGGAFSQGSRSRETQILSEEALLARPGFVHLYIGSTFSNVKVWLDGNYFAGSDFDKVTFVYFGQHFNWENNVLHDCSIELVNGAEAPSYFNACTKVIRKSDLTPAEKRECIGMPEKWALYRCDSLGQCGEVRNRYNSGGRNNH